MRGPDLGAGCLHAARQEGLVPKTTTTTTTAADSEPAREPKTVRAPRRRLQAGRRPSGAEASCGVEVLDPVRRRRRRWQGRAALALAGSGQSRLPAGSLIALSLSLPPNDGRLSASAAAAPSDALGHAAPRAAAVLATAGTPRLAPTAARRPPRARDRPHRHHLPPLPQRAPPLLGPPRPPPARGRATGGRQDRDVEPEV
jgi:hypothetical protein